MDNEIAFKLAPGQMSLDDFLGVRTRPARRPCLCGCGGYPKSRASRFLPGHDSRYYSILRRAALIRELERSFAGSWSTVKA